MACHSAIVCNAGHYGGKVLLTPEADISEPHLDLFCVTATGRLAYLEIIADVLAGRCCQEDQVTRLRGTEIEVTGDRAIQLDGDFYRNAPVKIGVVPEFARIMV